MRLTPEPKRTAIFTLYAWMRAADDIVDSGGHAKTIKIGSPDSVLQRLNCFESDTDQALNPDAPLPTGPLWPAVRQQFLSFRLPKQYLAEMIAGQKQDLEEPHFETFEQLEQYCYRVASVVGLSCVHIWGDDGDPSVATLAKDRGIALQLTNILRDIAEDAEQGRVYLPREDFKRFGIDGVEIKKNHENKAFCDLMQFEIGRTRKFYESSADLEKHLKVDGRRTSWAMMRTYRQLLEKIAARPELVLQRRVRLSMTRKLGIAAAALTRSRW